MNYLSEIKKNEFFRDADEQYLDSLTKVVNRKKTFEYMRYLIENDTPFIFCMIDVDNFKNVNDMHGHLIGDEILKKVAESIINVHGNNAIIGRFGGDEFMVVHECNDNSYEYAWNFAKELNHCADNFDFEAVESLKITLTTGITRFPSDGIIFEEIIDKADKALYRGKSKGRNCFIVYVHEKHKDISMESRNDIKINSTYMFMQIFDILSRDKNFSKNVKELISYLSNNLLIDHVCLQSNTKVIYDYVHSLSKFSEFKYIDTKLLCEQMNNYGMLNINQITGYERIRPALFDVIYEQKILAQLCFSIKYDNKLYGVLRIDMCTSNRIWQTEELNLLVTVANTLALIISNLNVDLDSLE